VRGDELGVRNRNCQMILFRLSTLICLASGLIFCAHTNSFGQHSNNISNIKFEQLSEGLSEKSVTCILQDQKGFMWFGTRNGLNRYDGVEFKIYEFVYDDSTSLSGNFINSLVEDSLGNIWVGTVDAGLNLYDRKRDIFIRYQPKAGDPNTLSDNWISDLYRDSKNNLWIGTEKEGLDLLEPGSTKFKHFKKDPYNNFSLSNNHVRVIFEDAKSNLWVGTYGGGLDLFDRKQNKFIHHRHDPQDESTISSNYLYSSLKDSEGNTWVGTREGLNLIVKNENGYSFKRYKPNIKDPTGLIHNIVLSIAEDNLGRLWIGMENGALTIYDKKTETFSNFWPNPLDPTSIGSNSIWSVYKDKMGTIWIGARNRGINKWDKYHTKFVHHILPPSGNHKLTNNDVLCFVEDSEGNLWIGTDGGGLNYLDRKTNKYTHYVHDPSDSKSLSSNSVISLELDSHGDLWVGTWEGGLNRLDKKTGIFHRYYNDPNDPKSIGSNYVFSIFEDSAGKLWVSAFYEGLDLYDRATDSFIHYKRDVSNPRAIGHNRVFTMFEDSKKNMWIGTEGGGLIHMEKDERDQPIFTSYRYNPNDPTSLSSNLINAIYEDTRHNLWIGTWAGLNKFDYQTKTFKAFRKEDGLADNVVYGIIEDGDGNFWVSTNQGISKFDPVNNHVENYNTADGLQAQEFIRGSFLKSKSGEFFFGGVNGFNSFYPNEITDNPNIPPVYITNFWIYNDLVKPGLADSPLALNITETDEIILPYTQNEFTFEFAALNYSQAFKNRYSYYLEGYDKNWHDAGSQRKASYAKVPPGSYTFRVKATNNDGVWNDKGTALRIIVNPPWWKTWWAYTVYVMAVTALFLWYRQNLINRERLKNDLKVEHLELTKMQEMDKLKSYFFANISHEFRTPLTLILSPIRDLAAGNFKGDIRKQYQMVIRNGERLLRLINQLLDLSKLGAGSMKLKTSCLDVVQFLKPIVAAFDSYAQRMKIKFIFEYPVEPVLVYFDPDKFEKIITNLLSNAFKFTREGEIKLSVSVIALPEKSKDNDDFNEKIEIAVTDSGTGIPQEYISSIFDHFYQVAHHSHSEGSGIGLSLTKELVELHKGEIRVESIEGQGSSFKVLFLLGKDHLTPAEIDESDGPIVTGNKTIVGFDNIYASSPAPSLEMTTENEGHNDFPRLLIVEDNTDMRTYIRQSLEESFQIFESADGKDGVKKGMEMIPDLIISDVMMPGMDGITLCRTMKNNIYTSHIPILLLTAKADLDSKIEGLETGADEYLSKPFNSYELKVRAKNLIRSREILRARFTESKKLILEPKEISITSLDEKFLKNVLLIIEKNMDDSNFRVESLGKELEMDSLAVYRKIKALTGQTAVEFIRTIRLKRAAQLLKQQKLTVAEVTYNVGFNDLQYFRTCFKKQFGLSPSDYMTKIESGIDI
jgi:signal transduction histidine kinase/ligand-binding sensor domain-containing protein/DNA-binding response OmpR family regulator